MLHPDHSEERLVHLLQNVDPMQIADLLRKVEVDEVLSRFRNLHDGDVETKTHAKDFVTKADTQAELVLTQALPSLLPGSLVVGEEAVSQNSDILKNLESDQFVWILDPVDGTREFVDGTSKFCMLVALTYKGVPYIAWIVTPDTEKPTDPSAQNVIIAVAGRGAYLNHFGDPAHKIILPSPPQSPDAMKVVLTRPDPTGASLVLPTERMPQLLGGLRATNCVGAEFVAMLRGENVHAVSYDRCYITPWDFAAPYLALQETGGHWWVDNGLPYCAAKDNSIRFIAAASETVARTVKEKLYPDTPWRSAASVLVAEPVVPCL